MAGDQSEIQSEERSSNSVVPATASPQTSRPFPPQTPPADRKLKDTCFRCKQQGHWAQDCPSNGGLTSKSSSPSLESQSLPVLRCHCGVACSVSVSHSAAHNGRKYYSRNCNCDNATRGRSFYKWCDDVKAPMCYCGAGACTINIQRDENGKDTKYYTCRIRTGHGSCGFLQFDSPPSSPNSWPRSTKKMDKTPSTLSPQHGNSPSVNQTHQINAAGSGTSLNGYAGVGEVSPNSFRNDTQPSGDALRTSSLETSFTAMEEGVTNTVGENLQKDTLTMEPPDNNTMLPANNTFDTAVSSLIECRPFVERLVESIGGISIVAGMESNLQGNRNQVVPSIATSTEKCLNDISGINAEAFATVTNAGSYHLQSAHEAASRIKDTLCRMEKLETYLLKTAKDVGQSKRYLQATYQELTKALKLPQEFEEQS